MKDMQLHLWLQTFRIFLLVLHILNTAALPDHGGYACAERLQSMRSELDVRVLQEDMRGMQRRWIPHKPAGLKLPQQLTQLVLDLQQPSMGCDRELAQQGQQLPQQFPQLVLDLQQPRLGRDGQLAQQGQQLTQQGQQLAQLVLDL